MGAGPSVVLNLMANDELTATLKKFSGSMEELGKISKESGGNIKSLSKDFNNHRAAAKAAIAPVQKLAEAHKGQGMAIEKAAAAKGPNQALAA